LLGPFLKQIGRVRVQTAAAVLAVVEEELTAIRSDPDIPPVVRARVVGSLARVALIAIERRDLVARVEALEAVLKGRPVE
jgi:hypothetical protein